MPEDTTSKTGRFEVPTFHGLSKNGSASGQLVYAGRGNREEFQALIAQGVDLKGKIAIVQYGGTFRGLKVKNAAEFGAVGARLCFAAFDRRGAHLAFSSQAASSTPIRPRMAK